MKKIAAMLVAGCILASSAVPALAGQWQRDDLGWWYQEDDGSYPAGKWQQISGKWYYFRDNGYMAENQWVDGKYYVNGNGEILTNATTPDGYQVGADGRLLNGASNVGNVSDSGGGDIDYGVYASVLKNLDAELKAEYGERASSGEYFLYDIDGDGIKELGVVFYEGSLGHSGARFYTIQDGATVYLGESQGSYSEIYARPAGGLYERSEARGYFTVYFITMSGNQLVSTEIGSGSSMAGGKTSDSYMPDAVEIPSYKTNDLSHLQ